MGNKQEQLNALVDIKSMMEKSTKFMSLSGWSGISIGIIALIGSFLVQKAYVGFSGPQNCLSNENFTVANPHTQTLFLCG